VGIRQHKAIFWVCMAAAAVTFGVFAYKASDLILGLGG
jgi:hypothetical protein